MNWTWNFKLIYQWDLRHVLNTKILDLVFFGSVVCSSVALKGLNLHLPFSGPTQALRSF